MASGISSSIQTNIMAPAAKLKAKGRMLLKTWAKRKPNRALGISTMAENCPYIMALKRDKPLSCKGKEIAVPSGKFWIPIPIDKISAGNKLLLTPAMAMPTAKPSGILWSVIASKRSLFLESLFWGPSFWWEIMCSWGKNLSHSLKKSPPIKKIIGIKKRRKKWSWTWLIAGSNKEKKVAAIIIPAAKPKALLISFWLLFFTK